MRHGMSRASHDFISFGVVLFCDECERIALFVVFFKRFQTCLPTKFLIRFYHSKSQFSVAFGPYSRMTYYYYEDLHSALPKICLLFFFLSATVIVRSLPA